MSNPSLISATDTKPPHEQIAVRAELLWKAKGSPSGRDEEFWLEAERQLSTEAREILNETSTPSSEDPNPSMGAQSSAAEEMKPTTASAPKSSRRRTSR